MNKYTIAKPIWDGGTKQRAIGIAEFRLPCLVNISYRDKHDNLVYPNQYIVTKEKARKYPIKVLGPVKVRVIPISELDTAPFIDNQPPIERWRDPLVSKKNKPKQKRKGYKTMSLNELLEKYPPKEKEE